MEIKPMAWDEKKWQIEEDCRTLVRAEEIKRDSKRFAAAKKLAKEQLQAMQAAVGETKGKASK